MTMTESLVKLMRRQWTTPLDALKHCNCMSLAQRVSLDMRHLNVLKDWRTLPSGKRVRAYKIVGGGK